MAPSDMSEAFAGHGVAVAYLFGSRAEGTAGPPSDHDVAVLFAEPEPAFDATVRLAADLSALLGAPVDVVDLDRAGLELRGRVADAVAGSTPWTSRAVCGSRSTLACGGSSSAPSCVRRRGPTCGESLRRDCVDGRTSLMVDDDRVRRLLAHAVRDGGLDDLSAFAMRIAGLVDP